MSREFIAAELVGKGKVIPGGRCVVCSGEVDRGM